MALQSEPDVIVGIDFGMTSTAVAYSFGPRWDRPENIQQWEGLSVSQIFNKVPSAITYTTNSSVAWGFSCDYDGAIQPKDEFKLELDPNYLPNDPDRTPLVEARGWYHDYMKCLHDFLAVRFDDILPQWRTQQVEWHFSVPTTWTSINMKRDILKILESCGYGADGTRHSLQITLTEAEAAAVHAAKQSYKKGDVVLVCDAGGGTTDVNILRLDSDPSQPAVLTPLDHDEGRAIGSTDIDEAFQKMAEERLNRIAGHLNRPPDVVARKMVRSSGDRFQSVKHGFYQGASAQQPAYPIAIPDLEDALNINRPELNIHNGKLFLSSQELQQYFDDQVDRIIALIKERLDSLAAKDQTATVTYIVLTGGLGSSPYVKKRLVDVFETGGHLVNPNAIGLKVIQGNGAQIAVSRGLVQARIEKVKYKQEVFAFKCAQASYGMVVRHKLDKKALKNRPFNPDDEFDKDPAYGTTFLVNQIEWIVVRGKPIKSGEAMKKYTLGVKKGRENEEFETVIVTCSAPPRDLPRSLKAAKRRKDFEEACKIKIVMPPSQIHKRRVRWFKKVLECIFNLRIIPEAAEIRFELLTKDGQACSTTDGGVSVEWGGETIVELSPMHGMPQKTTTMTLPMPAELSA